MGKKNILLTTLHETKNRLDVNYFVCDTLSGVSSYTTGISVAEAGIKYLLSQRQIDEIIIIGSMKNVSDEYQKPIKISDNISLRAADINEMNEYEFLSYRIDEFLRQMDFELLDVGEPVSNERKQELKERLSSFRFENASNIRANELFLKLSTDKECEELFRNEILNTCNSDEEKWIKYNLFSELDPYYKMHILDENRNTVMRYMPIDDGDTLSAKTISDIVSKTLGDSDDNINLYMDIQGLVAIDGNTLISTFLLTNNRTGYRCSVKGLIESRKNSGDFAGKVSNVLKSYEIQKMITGLDIFLEYGKFNLLRSYWDTMNLHDEDSNRIFYGMDCVDEGITLCNVDLIACGINVIRKTINNPRTDPNDRNIYLDIIINAIIADYGELLYGDTLSIPELLKWTLKKGLYQQTLTIIESKVPKDIVDRGIYYYARSEEDIVKLMKEFNFLYWNETAKMRWAFNDIEHFFIKLYGRACLNYRQKPDLVVRDYAALRIDALRGRTEDVLPAYSELNNDKMLYDLLLGYYRIGNLRNQVNHAEVDEVDVDVDKITPRKDNRTELRTELKKFIGLYSSVCRKTEKKHEPVILPSGRMKAYSLRHKLEPLEETTDLTNKNTYTCSFNGKEVRIDISLFKPEDAIE